MHLLTWSKNTLLIFSEIDSALLACLEIVVNTHMRKEGGFIINNSKFHSVLDEGRE